MFDKSKREESIHVEEIFQGKSASISYTISLVRIGASFPAVRAGRPVTASVMIFALKAFFLRGVRTMLPDWILASRGSPARIPSLRRSGLGRTTCPFVETRVCMVRQSYCGDRCTANGTHPCCIRD